MLDSCWIHAGFFASLRRKLTGVPDWQGVTVRAAASGHRPDHGVSACCHHPGRSLRSDISSPPRDVLLCLSALLCPVCEREQTTHNKTHQNKHTHTHTHTPGPCGSLLGQGRQLLRGRKPQQRGGAAPRRVSLNELGKSREVWVAAVSFQFLAVVLHSFKFLSGICAPAFRCSVLGFAEARQLQLASSRVSCSQSHLAWLCWTSLVHSLTCQEGQGWPLQLTFFSRVATCCER